MNCSMDELEQQLEKLLRIVQTRHKPRPKGLDDFKYVFKLQTDILKDMLKEKP